MTKSLPESAQKVVDRYLNLQLGGKSVIAPYYINIQRKKDLRALVGKGTPEEMEMEAKIWEKLKGVNFSEMSEFDIRNFLMQRGIGIDCSGFIMHVINSWYKAERGKTIWGKMKPYTRSLLHKLAYKLKPVEKLGAEIITNENNAIKININDVLPGDVIRSKWKRKNAHHILLVSKVTYDENSNVSEIEYVNSTEQYGDNNGVRSGKIVIKDPNLPLEKQKWIDSDENGVNHTYEGFLFNVEDNGLRRIKAMQEIINR